MSSNRKVLIAAVLLLFVLFVFPASADPPTPHSIAGYIYTSNGVNQVPLGTSYEINETVSKAYIRAQTSIPVPGMSGRYFNVISGVNGDLTIVRAWNLTHYGNISVLLQDGLDNVNVFLNKTRNPETNVTRLFPANNSVFNTSVYFNVTVNITVLGANGTVCNATINFSNQSAFVLGAGETATHQIGDVNLTSHNVTMWNLTAIKYGTYNITVSAVCSNQTVVLERRDVAWINVSVNDVTPPLVQLMLPWNNSLSRTNTIDFTFNVSETANILNCSLVINDRINITNTSVVQKDAAQVLRATLNSGFYNWSVNCTDEFGNIGASATYNLTVNASGPLITEMRITSPIALLPATTTSVTCNATVTISDLMKNITIINATLYDPSSAGYLSPNDKNNHYTNATCNRTAKDGILENYSCSFALWYYSNNATWICNLSAMDTDNLTGTGNISTLLNELVAFDVNSSVLNYGNLNVTNISGISNITLYNFGNKDLNVSFKGFAVSEQDGLAMVCGLGTNISIGYERYSSSSLAEYEEMTSLTGNSVMLANFTLFQRTNDESHDQDVNSTYWRISVPPPAASNCSGVINLLATKA
jgi:hypothetical protein